MTPEILAKQSTALVTERDALMRDLLDIATYNAETGDFEPLPATDNVDDSDEADLGDGYEETAEHIATLALLETRYRNVVRALEKIDHGTYGICEISGGPIEPERLQANPAARTCLAHLEDEADLPL